MSARRKIHVGVTRKLPYSTRDRLEELFDVEMNTSDAALTRDELKAMTSRCDVLCPTVTDTVDADVIAAGKGRLRLIANFGAGTDHIDLDAAQDAGILVSNTPDVLTEDTADMAMALLLAVPRRILEGAELLRAGGYHAGWSPTWMMGASLQDKKLGIIGMGRIGQALAKRARAFGLEVHYHNRSPVSPTIEDGLQALYWEDLDDMLAEMDFISLNCPLTETTHHLMNAARLAKLPDHAVIVNTARGKLIDEAALADALEAGKLGGAGLDVFEHEPEVEPRLLQMASVVALPHMGSSTLEARMAMGERMIINIRAFEDGHKPPNRVIAHLGERTS